MARTRRGSHTRFGVDRTRDARPVGDRIAGNAHRQLLHVQLAHPPFRQVVVERHVAQTEVIGLLDVEVGGAAPVGVAVIAVVGEIAGVFRIRVARVLPTVVDVGGDGRVALPDRVLDHAGLHVVVDRMSERIIQVDRQRQPLVTERVADTARRVGHDVAQVEHVLGVDDFIAVGIARRTVTVAPLVVAGVLAARNLLSVAHAVAFRQGVVIGCVGLGLGLDDVVDLVAVDTPQRLADGRAAESVSRLRHLVAAYAVGLPAGRVAVHVHLVVGVLLGQRQHLVAVVGVGQPEVPREVLGTDHLRVQFGLETVETAFTLE